MSASKGITVYCHFSFRRPKGTGTGLFAVAFYNDYEGKKLLEQITRKYDLWEDSQFVTAVQSYEHALRTIYEWQGAMKANGINQVMLVTDNSTLAGWIENPKKNKVYEKYMRRAVEPYRVGGPREIVIGVGLCEVRKYEKSYKFCREDKVQNHYSQKVSNAKRNCIRLNINGENGKLGYKSALDIIKEDPNNVEIVGMKEVQ